MRIGETVDLRVADDCLIISPERKPRHGWDGAFQASNHSAQTNSC